MSQSTVLVEKKTWQSSGVMRVVRNMCHVEPFPDSSVDIIDPSPWKIFQVGDNENIQVAGKDPRGCDR